MDHGETRDVEPALNHDHHDSESGHGERDTAAQVVQVDLFGMPIEPATSSSAESRMVNRAGERARADTGGKESRTGGGASAGTGHRATLWHDIEEHGEDGQSTAEPHPANASSDTTAPSADARPATAKKRRAREVSAAPPSADLVALAAQLPPNVHLGTSTWSFPGWQGIVYGDEYSNSKLSREGLGAYSAHPLLRTVSIDRSFYQALTVTEYLRYAQQVPDDFRFIVKAPMTITDATVRAERGEPVSLNPCFLNAQMAIDDFVTPCIEGLGAKAGALVFQLSPLPDQMLAQPAAFVERLAGFFNALPPLPEGPCYAIEIRDASLLTPRFIRALKATGVRYCVGIHARMPDPLRQAAALALLDGAAGETDQAAGQAEGAGQSGPAGPLIVRWSLHGGFKYEQAKAKYEPFDKLVDEDPATRTALAELAARYALAGQPVVIAINNKAEGSAPLSCVKLARAIVDAYARLAHEANPPAAAAAAPEPSSDEPGVPPDPASPL